MDYLVIICEKIMGWKRLSYKDAFPNNAFYQDNNEITPYWYDENGKRQSLAGDLHTYEGTEYHWNPFWSYEDALDILDRIPMRFCYIRESEQYKTRRHKAYFMKDSGEGFSVSYGNLFSEVLCKAALKTINIEYNEKTAR